MNAHTGTTSVVLAGLRRAMGRLTATRPLPEITDAVIQNPLHGRAEADEAMTAMAVEFGRIADYFARLRATEAIGDVNHSELLLRFMGSPAGRRLLVTVLVANPEIVDQRVETLVDERVNAIVTERIKTIQVKQRNHFFFARMFSWIGMIVGALFGAILGLVTNFYLDAGTVTMTEGGAQYVGADIIDTLPGQIGIVALLALAFGAFGGALFNRRNDDSDN